MSMHSAEQAVTTIYILSVSHKHGVNVSAHRSQEAALASLASYVAGEWYREMPDGDEMPNSEGEAIQAYFDGDHGEYFSIEECDLQD